MFFVRSVMPSIPELNIKTIKDSQVAAVRRVKQSNFKKIQHNRFDFQVDFELNRGEIGFRKFLRKKLH